MAKKKPRETRLKSIAQNMCDDSELLDDRDLFAHIVDFQTTGNLTARETAIKANLRLVWNIARAFARPGVEVPDIVMDGFPGLARAVEGFETDRGTKFSTYASYWIKQTIRRAIVDTGSTIRLPQGKHTLYAKIAKFCAEFDASFGSTATIEEIAEGLDKKPKQIRACLDSRKYIGVLSENAIGPDRKSVSRFIFQKHDPNPPPEEVAAQSEMLARMMEKLGDSGMDPRERTILMRRFGLSGNEPQTLKEIGLALGLTRERVRQIEEETLKRLRKRLERE